MENSREKGQMFPRGKVHSLAETPSLGSGGFTSQATAWWGSFHQPRLMWGAHHVSQWLSPAVTGGRGARWKREFRRLVPGPTIPASIRICSDTGTAFPGGSVVKSQFVKQETRVRSLGQEDPLKKEMATHSNILAWETPWTEEPGGLHPMELQKVQNDLVNKW